MGYISRAISTLNRFTLIVTLLISDLLIQVGLDCPKELAVQGPRLYVLLLFLSLFITAIDIFKQILSLDIVVAIL